MVTGRDGSFEKFTSRTTTFLRAERVGEWRVLQDLKILGAFRLQRVPYPSRLEMKLLAGPDAADSDPIAGQEIRVLHPFE